MFSSFIRAVNASGAAPRQMSLLARREQLARVIAFAGMSLALVLVLLAPQNFVFDDGYFYVQIARNIAQHGQGTFHTISSTNGYHPLWMAICSGIAYVVTSFSASDRLLLDAIILVQVGVLLWGMSCLVQLEREIGLKHSSMSIGLLLYIFIGGGTLLLLETPLAMALLIYAICRYVVLIRDGRYAPGQLLRFSLVLALLVLARLDMVFFAAFCMFGLLLRYGRRFSLRDVVLRSFAVGMPCAVLVGVYLLANHALWGSYLPISGIIKSNLPGTEADRMHAVAFHNHVHMMLVPSLVIVFFILCEKDFLRGKRQQRRAGLFLLEMSCFSLVHMLYTLYFGFPAIWYFIQQLLIFALFGNYVFSQRPQASRTRLLPVIALFLASANMFFAYNNYREDYGALSYHMQRIKKHRIETAQQLERSLPPQAGVIVFDIPGSLAYYTRLRIFPTDGLVNGVSYDEDLRREGILPYFCRRGIHYLFAPRPTASEDFSGLSIDLYKTETGYRLVLLGPKTRKSAGTVDLPEESLVAHFTNGTDINKELELGVWELPCPAAP